MHFRKFIFFILALSNIAFSEKIPMKLRCEYALKMHQGFCLQSAGQSGTAFRRFNEGYRDALQAGIAPRKMQAIWNFFLWYRKFGDYLGLYSTDGDNRILDAYKDEDNKTVRSFRFRTEAEKIRDRYEIAEISREVIFYSAEAIGCLLGAAILPNVAWRASSVLLAFQAGKRAFDGLNRLKTFNDIAKHELQQRMKEIENAASNLNEEEWWLR